MATTGMNEAPTDVEVKKLPLSPQQRQWLEAAYAQVDLQRMTRFNVDVVSIHSPTGRERAVNEWMTAQMQAMGLDAFYQRIDDQSGNAVGYLRGTGTGPSLMLYAPIDTHLDADPETEVPWVGPALRPDMLPRGYVDENGNVIGLGASNPKGMVTAIIAAVDAVKRAGVPLQGDVLAAFAGGGMPVNAPPNSPRMNIGLGSGVAFMLQQGVTADCGIIVKPGYAVSWEEPGLCWFKITVRGYLDYAGFPHHWPGYKNTILDISRVALELEEWLKEYRERNASGLVAPTGALGALRAGWPYRPAFPPAAAELYVDIRVAPRTSPSDVKAQFGEAMERIRAKHPDIALDWEMFASYPSASTDPHHWIVQSTMRGWEHVEGRPHKTNPQGVAGQTDASLIRNLGIPLARIGQPGPVPGTPKEWSQGLGGMGVSHIPDLARVARVLIYAIIDTCTRSRDEVGLSSAGR